MKPEPWWIGLLRLFVESFLGWIRVQGREELAGEIKDKRDEQQREWDEIDARPADGGALDRLFELRRAEDAARRAAAGEDSGGD